MILIPVFMAVIICDFFCNETATRLVGAALFGITAFTDMLDGKIARKRGLITDFGKFLDPVADKLMIIGAYLAILTLIKDDAGLFYTLICAAFIVTVREIAVTSLRMIVSTKSEVVIAAAWPGSSISGIISMPRFAAYSTISFISSTSFSSSTVSTQRLLMAYWAFMSFCSDFGTD